MTYRPISPRDAFRAAVELLGGRPPEHGKGASRRQRDLIAWAVRNVPPHTPSLSEVAETIGPGSPHSTVHERCTRCARDSDPDELAAWRDMVERAANRNIEMEER